jgi:hypothetical protein
MSAIKTLRIAYIGADWNHDFDYKSNLIFLILKKASQRNVEVVKKIKDADLIVVYPYLSGSWAFRAKCALATFAKKIFQVNDCTSLLRWMLGVGRTPMLFISHENLDRPFWWKLYGNFLINSKVPRLTFWPKIIDPRGCRFPYWYNYLSWKEYPRDDNYARFGRYYSATELLTPLVIKANRKDAVVVISSHLDHPRDAMIKKLATQQKIEIYGSAGISFKGTKIELMRNYKFAFCAENSVGFGYDTEKIPEAWVAGCIPIVIYLNPFSDFNPEILNLNPEDPKTYTNVTLLKSEPSLEEVEAYVKKEFF